MWKAHFFCFMLKYTTLCQRLNGTPTLYIVFRSHPSFSFGFQFRSLPFCTGEACYLYAWLIIQTTKNRVCVIFLQKYYWSILFSSIKIDHSMTKKTLSSSKQHLSVKTEQGGCFAAFNEFLEKWKMNLKYPHIWTDEVVILTVRPVILCLIFGHSSKAEVWVNNSIGFVCLFSSLDQQYPHLPFCLVKSTEYKHVCMISEVVPHSFTWRVGACLSTQP